ncbi:MAG: MerC domain-containing protein [Pirellula sp.]
MNRLNGMNGLNGNAWKDSVGIAASVLCAIHCAATPVLLAVLPNLSLTGWMASPWFHQAAAFVCIALVGTSIWPAYKKHKDGRVLGFSSAGLALIFGSAFIFPADCCSSGTCGGHAVASVESDSSGCGDDCAFCAARASKEAATAGVEPAADGRKEPETFLAGVSLSGLWNGLLHWVTPVGGGLLVIAHFLNMRRSFGRCAGRCGCKVSEPSDTQVTVESLTQAA